MRMMTKREKIEFLLCHWTDYYEPRGSGLSCDGSFGVPLLPLMSRHPSVVELNRCIELLRRTAKHHCAHLMAYYTAEWRTVQRPVKAGNGKPLKNKDGTFVTAPARDRVLPGWFIPRMADRGLDFIVSQYDVDRSGGDVFIPTDLLELVA